MQTGVLAESKFDVKTIWHLHFGHMSFRKLSKVVNVDCKGVSATDCFVCLMARQARLPFSRSNSRSMNPLDLFSPYGLVGALLSTNDRQVSLFIDCGRQSYSGSLGIPIAIQ